MSKRVTSANLIPKNRFVRPILEWTFSHEGEDRSAFEGLSMARATRRSIGGIASADAGGGPFKYSKCGCIRRWPNKEQEPGQEEDRAAQLAANDAEVTERHYSVILHGYRNWHQHQH